MGKAFGELALINNKPRLATVKCVSDCHFAVISKNVYERILKKIEVKNQNKLVDFFQHLPFFAGWSRTALAKLKYVFHPREFQIGQKVVLEGDSCDKIILIRTGEFKVLKDPATLDSPSIEKEERTERQLKRIVELDKLNKNEDSPVRQSNSGVPLVSFLRNEFKSKKAPKPLPVLVALLGPGELFGDYEALCSFPKHEFTLECKSLKGEVLVLDKVEFAKKISVVPNAIKELIERSKEKRFLFFKNILNIKTVGRR